MFVIDDRFVEVIVLLVLTPGIGGPFLAKWAGERAKRTGSSPAMVRGVRSLITVAWVAVVAFGLSVTYGPIPFLSTLTFTAIGGIAVTLALQTTLQNIVAGFWLQRNRFLHLKDAVLFSGLSGTVVSMGLVTTVLRLEDGSLAFVSNSNLLSGPMVNRTATRRLAGEY